MEDYLGFYPSNTHETRQSRPRNQSSSSEEQPDLNNINVMFPPVPATHQVFHHAPAPLLSLQAESSLPVVCNVGSAAAGWWELQLLVAVAVLLRDPSLSPVAPPSLSTSLSTRHHCNELPTFSSWTAVNWTDEAEARASEYETCTLSVRNE
ncbi:hypothetical protein BKA80DRAFT_253508 [Phyllosticta citrichinensis]